MPKFTIRVTRDCFETGHATIEAASFEEASAQLQATQNVPGVIVWEGFSSLGASIEPIDEDDLIDTEEV